MSEGVPRVFLDSEVFIRNNFNYASPRFESLRRLGADKTIRIFVTDLTVREVEANLNSLIESASTSLRPDAVLRNSRLPDVKAHLERLDVPAIQRELRAQLQDFLKAANVTTLTVEPSALPDVLNAY